MTHECSSKIIHVNIVGAQAIVLQVKLTVTRIFVVLMMHQDQIISLNGENMDIRN